MDNDLKNIESVLISFGVGPGRRWSSNFIIAHGWVGNYNGLASAIDYMLHRMDIGLPANEAYKQSLYHLDAMLVHLRMCKPVDSWTIAELGLKYWLFGRCVSCTGTGLTKEQGLCPECGGTGWLPSTDNNKRCVAIIVSALENMERAVGQRLVGAKMEETHGPVHSFNPLSSIYGTVTPACPEYG